MSLLAEKIATAVENTPAQDGDFPRAVDRLVDVATRLAGFVDRTGRNDPILTARITAISDHLSNILEKIENPETPTDSARLRAGFREKYPSKGAVV